MSKDKLDKLNPYKDTAKKYFPNGGEINTSGRKKGEKTKNNVKVTKISRNALTWALEGHSTKIRMALDALFNENPEAYINAVSKLLNYTVPKLSSAEINDNTTKKVKIELNDDVSINDLRAKLDEIDNN
tara:strand:- start:829 stop:1215 length:387 start_codon:yes stop_codon:yes gene_type:complete